MAEGGRREGMEKLSDVEVPLVLVPLFTRRWEGAMFLPHFTFINPHY